MNQSITGPTGPTADHSQRRVTLATAFSLLAMALLAGFAQFGVLANLIVPTDAAATTHTIAASIGPFTAAIAAFLVVAVLDVVVAWGLYVLLRPVHARVALLVGGLRIVYAAAFAYALLDLVEVAQLLNGAAATLQSGQVQSQVAASVTGFRTGWDLALAVFGLSLVGLGGLLARSADFPRVLGGLVILAGAGYLADSIGKTLVTGYTLTISTVTFVGEVLLIVWLFKLAITGSRSFGNRRSLDEAPVRPSQAAAS